MQQQNVMNERLKKRGYRLTPQRHMILSVINEANGHLSIEQIAERVQERNPYVSLSTIYRNLDLLKELGLIRENHLPNEPSHYESAEGPAHHHLVCLDCKTMVHLAENLLGDLHQQIQHQYQFHSLTLELVISGYCDECWKKREAAHSHTSDAVPAILEE